MRNDILDYLLAHRGEYISGQKLSEQLGISRTAVWKHIQLLKQRNYRIESHTKRGYCLHEAPELLPPERILDGLKTVTLGREIAYYERVSSTNTLAKQLADQGAPEGTLVLAEEQFGGRGRLDRAFLSPFAQGLWFSLILRPPFLPMEVAKMTLLAAVALTRAIRHMGVQCAIKWPNDLLVKGRKLVGILTELNASMERLNYLVLGMGINTSLKEEDVSPELRRIVTSFAMEQVPVSRQKLLQEVLCQLEKYYMIAKEDGFAPILQEWKELSCILGTEVGVALPQGNIIGTAVDLDDSGNLIVVAADGRKETILAGDVRVRPVHKYDCKPG
ncbi:biotin--[acetyl-CoA-carboxylase] ligase [Megasphaera vaginalis (ex Bordigoni et al. 2020)]|uniref:biotin--[acetyl-CoA-carboxylase] ligase n=1 Tax=Megasphaera vaginalis (ex Bordigoni et al. 2020) TaxID=2045301 RepID=UPI000C7E303A|nr:biotin--[acetyl-CoA-carboxylase] ligase [Megasphaera vaginalis (ex Bordigoni et al. 2020)]